MSEFNSSSPPSNSLADDMWRAFLNETGADCTITCESFSDAEQSIGKKHAVKNITTSLKILL